AADARLQGSWSTEFIPVNARWPVAMTQRLADLVQEAWYLYHVPPYAVLALAAVGWCLWAWKQRVAALAAAMTVLVTIAANAAGLWPIGDGLRSRVNLPIIAIIHLSLIALPVIGADILCSAWLRQRGTAGNTAAEWTKPSLAWISSAAVVLAIAVAAVVVRE